MELREQIIDLCKAYRVQRLYVYGSFLRSDFGEDSDIDLAVIFEDIPVRNYFDNFWDFKFALEKRLSREIDLLEWDAVRNPILKRRILEERELLYEREDREIAV